MRKLLLFFSLIYLPLQAQYITLNGKILSVDDKVIYDASQIARQFVPDSVYFWMVLGQSNTGRSDINLIPADSAKYDGVIPNAYIFNNVLSSTRTISPLDPNINTAIAGSPRGFDGEVICGYWLPRYTNRDVVFYKYGIGGTSLATDWRKGYALYDTAITRYLPTFLDQMIAQNHMPIFKGIIWLQGESDQAADSATYYGYLKQFFDSVQVDYTALAKTRGIPQCTDFRKVITEIKTTSAYYGSGVAAAQREYTKTGNANRAVLVDTDGVPFRSDSTHYTATGHLTLGWRIYNTIKNY